MAAKFEVKKGPTGKFRFSLRGKNGRVIASSETYNTKAACLDGIKAVKAAAGGADVEDQTTKAWADEQARVKPPPRRRPARRRRPSDEAAAVLAVGHTGPVIGDPVTITYGATTLNANGRATLVTGLTPDTDYTFSVAAFNQAGESAALTATAHTRPDTAPVLSSIVEHREGSFLVSAPDLRSAFVDLVVPGIDTVEHPPQPVCSSYSQEGQNQAGSSPSTATRTCRRGAVP